ncbi:MAG: phosphatidylglycerol lysyltransferase domain-containing protein [Bacteroidales bacterium]|nr:phosphatidylglycerol lysyltransferase domain-containing protein [Bacteroidales bacterium]
MLEFKKIELKDKVWADSLLKLSDFRGAEYCFTNLFIWDGIYQSKIGRYKDFLLLRTGSAPDFRYLYPAGKGDVKEVIELMMEDAARCDSAFTLIGVTEQTEQVLNSNFPDRFNFYSGRDTFDYIYESEKLISLSGKKLQPKRNHLNYFTSNNNWSYEELNSSMINEIKEFNHEWCARVECKKYETLSWESCAVEKCLDNYHLLNLRGGVLRVDGKIVAYTIGEILNSDTVIIHIEKAFSEVRGAYPMINKEFLSRVAPGYQYVNREDDIGDEGLRKAKESYYPIFMLEKFYAKLF